MKKFTLLQIFRGLAAVGVLFFHIIIVLRELLNIKEPFNFFSVGFSGVDFFFVLSGFIIMFAHYRDFGIRKKILPFFRKRIIRIYPVYWIISLGIIGVYFFMGKNPVNHFQINPLFTLKAISLYPHWPMVIPTAWSLSYEAYFYLLIGLCLFFLTPNRTMVFFAVYALIVAGLNYLGRAPSLPIPIDYFILEFFLGVFVAWIYMKGIRVSGNRSLILFCFAALLVIASLLVYKPVGMDTTLGQKYRPLLFGIPMALLILSSVFMESNFSLKPVPFFSNLGDASYSLYLLHPSVITFIARALHHRIRLTNELGILVLVLGAIGVSFAFHYAVERPLLSFMRRKFHQPAIKT